MEPNHKEREEGNKEPKYTMHHITPILNTTRSFSSLAPVLREWKLIETRRVARQPAYKVGDPKPTYMPKEVKKFPAYKYGEPTVFKQSGKGLYGGSFIQFGNSVSESKHKTRRRWLPNIVRKELWSEALNKKIDIRLTTKVLKTISKEGGIDNYLTKEKSARIKELGPTGWRLRYLVLKAREGKSRDYLKDLEVVNGANGEEIVVYFNGEINGKKYRITESKNKLLRALFPLEKMEYKADGKELTRSQFAELYHGVTIEEILTRLDKYGFDLSTVSYQE